ncbi:MULTISPECIES: hypothetical protein [Actinobacillus]|uniref:Uncharacterized protein n=3 Tax=Actinobacillus pleuropneumoniae TaxID=715 RepID=A0A223MBV5_ACTPL|nr:MULTISPECIES: hypothetical protein [Actinobacillus]ABY69671.1 hypothetical protein APJL_1115 [Actinobacillus pleuropneumoniae serovar 3 str. JL03]ASU14926.1 hypothetical protein CHY23_00109 [Actinobacillus pleuropneumoniae]AWG95535.1 hypothetical protein APPSER1_06020 [Actinobacillus pleuropneumoniae serovar 1 str. 4074]AXA21606.1 hypothetical protein DRF63_06015 [Actinobacillus pleuropneumoniae]KIE90744.1 hypothetical protein AP518_02895 [Actinobacillus pleuropneumoniae]
MAYYTTDVSSHFQYDELNNDRKVLHTIHFFIDDRLSDHQRHIDKWQNHIIINRSKYPKFISSIRVNISFYDVIIADNVSGLTLERHVLM